MENKYEYYVTSNYGIDIKDIEYDLDRNTWRDSNVDNKIVPHRIVEKTDKILGSKRNTVYLLTLEEAKKLRKDPRVLGVTKKLSPEEDYTYDEVSLKGNFGRSTNLSATNMLPSDILTYQFSGSAVERANLFNSGSFTSSYDYSYTGKNVDLVVLDSSPSFNPFHLDFYDPYTGKSRVTLTDWSPSGSRLNIDGQDRELRNTFYKALEIGTMHGTQTLSKAGGTIFGAAKGANLRYMNATTGNTIFTGQDISILGGVDRFIALQNFHNRKPREKTLGGAKIPTVVVQSQTSRTNIAGWHITGSYVSESFNFPNCDNLQGIRINYLNKDYCIISSSGTSDILNEDINDVREVGNYYFYSSSDFTGLKNKINNTTELSDLFSCSISGNEISLTSSIKIDWYMKVYTGSIYQFSGSGEDIQTPFGGNFAVELTGSAPPRFNIDGWYPGGTLTDTPIKGNPPRLEYGFPELKKFDHFGIDNGWNIPSSPSLETLGNPDSDDPDVDFQNYDPSVDAEIEELANTGVIYIVAAGNRKIGISRSGSESSPFHTSSLYNEFLWNSYFISQRDNYSFADPGDPTYYLRGYPSTTSYLSVGAVIPTTIKRVSFLQLGLGAITGDKPYYTCTSNRGSGVDIYAVTNQFAAFKYNTYDDFGTNRTQDFFTSLNNIADPSNLSASLAEFREGNPFSIPISSGSLKYGGSSCAAPSLAGVVCLYLEKNPFADLADVRNFLYDNAQPCFIHTTGSFEVTQSDFLFNNQNYESTRTNGIPYYDYLYVTQSLYGGPNKLLFNPFGGKEFKINIPPNSSNVDIKNCRLTSRF